MHQHRPEWPNGNYLFALVAHPSGPKGQPDTGAGSKPNTYRLTRLPDGRYRWQPKRGAALTLTAEALVKRLVALVPPRGLHLTCFHGVFAPNARLRRGCSSFIFERPRLFFAPRVSR